MQLVVGNIMRSSDYTVKVHTYMERRSVTTTKSIQHGLTGLGGCFLVTWIVTPAGAWGCSGQGGTWHASAQKGIGSVSGAGTNISDGAAVVVATTGTGDDDETSTGGDDDG